MKVLKDYVLVEQVMTEKESQIILDASKDQQQKFDFKFKVLAKGPNCKDEGILVDSKPIFRKHVQFEGVSIIEKTKKKMVSHLLVHEGDIIALED